MSITDELREYAGNFYLFRYKDVREKLDAIADRIDAEYEKSIVDALLNDGIPATDENMAEHGWVRLPVDADGEYIHIGDVMTSKDGEVHKVVSLVRNPRWYDYEWSIGLTLLVKGVVSSGLVQYRPDTLRHHHAPTVEDVLEEYRVRYYDLVTDMECKNITNDEYAQSIKSLNAEYAAKLRLAGDAE